MSDEREDGADDDGTASGRRGRHAARILPRMSRAVELQELEGSHAAEFIAAVRASRELHHPWVDAPDSAMRFAWYLQRAAREDHRSYVVRHIACGALAGFINLNNIVRGGFQSAYLGYAAFFPHARRGLMSEALELVVASAFTELGLHRLEANIQPANAASIALVGRLGFEKEGFSPRYLKIAGDWRDHERWALRIERWAARGAAGGGAG